ncbi:hypothetical protein AXFE_32640 [Acidithrix ferrooxidans]|uniref:Uncharacterized protein n=1 Tax=Acidithrix ferrooxidans TaxID=1280514 RepID=A0A0D8HDN0_9ACTN|nr:hypothetical protein AXFE_32640 [Acidithrix ferrooxidans]
MPLSTSPSHDLDRSGNTKGDVWLDRLRDWHENDHFGGWFWRDVVTFPVIKKVG